MKFLIANVSAQKYNPDCERVKIRFIENDTLQHIVIEPFLDESLKDSTRGGFVDLLRTSSGNRASSVALANVGYEMAQDNKNFTVILKYNGVQMQVHVEESRREVVVRFEQMLRQDSKDRRNISRQ